MGLVSQLSKWAVNLKFFPSIDTNYEEILDNYDYSHFDYLNKPINATLVSIEFEDNFASFTCTVNLAPKETAKLRIEAYIYAHELKSNYNSVALFNVPSKGELYDSFVHKRALVKYQFQSEVIKVILQQFH